MKQILIFIFLTSLFCVYDSAGEYINPVGERILLNRDKSFFHSFQIGHTAYWQKGKWKTQKDTVYLQPIIVYDTLRRLGLKDSLILSIDIKPDLLTSNDGIVYEMNEMRKVQAKNHNTTYTKYVLKKDKLIAVDHKGDLKVSSPKHELLRNRSPENFYDPSYIKIK